ncbi:MAG: septum formation protein Maf [Elusimicrobia bacterium]|nr:septum formation protein Maf [Elusimicrobiota bacterium]
MRPLILASASPQRKKLLKELRIPFKIVPSKVDENSKETNPRKLVAQLSLKKAEEVARKRPHCLVLGADTVVWCAGKILGKPEDKNDAKRILGGLNGKWHRVYTGVALVDAQTGKAWKEVAVSRVKARKLPDEDIERLSAKHMDKAGAYAVQDKDDPFIEKIVGAYDNVVGLPLTSVRRLLKRVARGR